MRETARSPRLPRAASLAPARPRPSRCWRSPLLRTSGAECYYACPPPIRAKRLARESLIEKWNRFREEALSRVREPHFPCAKAVGVQRIDWDALLPLMSANHARRLHALALHSHADRAVTIVDVVRVLKIFLPGILHAVVLVLVAAFGSLPAALDRERLAVELRVDESDLDLDALTVRRFGELFYGAQLRARRLTVRIELGVAVKSDAVDDQRVAFPVTDGVSDVARLESFRVLGVELD